MAKTNVSVYASTSVDIWSGRLLKDSFIAATIQYIGDESLKNAVGLEGLIRNHDAHAVSNSYHFRNHIRKW